MDPGLIVLERKCITGHQKYRVNVYVIEKVVVSLRHLFRPVESDGSKRLLFDELLQLSERIPHFDSDLGLWESRYDVITHHIMTHLDT